MLWWDLSVDLCTSDHGPFWAPLITNGRDLNFNFHRGPGRFLFSIRRTYPLCPMVMTDCDFCSSVIIEPHYKRFLFGPVLSLNTSVRIPVRDLNNVCMWQLLVASYHCTSLNTDQSTFVQHINLATSFCIPRTVGTTLYFTVPYSTTIIHIRNVTP